MLFKDFSKEQLKIIQSLKLSYTPKEIKYYFDNLDLLSELPKEKFLDVKNAANAIYREGHRYINDLEYDTRVEGVFRKRFPYHSSLDEVEKEPVKDSKTVPLPKNMLSTDKAYSFSEIKKWTERLVKSGTEIGLTQDDIRLKVTPKLDGYAAYDDGSKLYTRGDGEKFP